MPGLAAFGEGLLGRNHALVLRIAGAGNDGRFPTSAATNQYPAIGRYAAIVVGADGGRTPTTAEVTDGEIVLEGNATRYLCLSCTKRLQTSFVNDVNGVNDYCVVCKLNDRLGTPC